MIPADLLEILRCPQTGQRLAVAGAEVLARLPEPPAAALVRADGTALYPILDGIPALLVESAIPLRPV